MPAGNRGFVLLLDLECSASLLLNIGKGAKSPHCRRGDRMHPWSLAWSNDLCCYLLALLLAWLRQGMKLSIRMQVGTTKLAGNGDSRSRRQSREHGEASLKIVLCATGLSNQMQVHNDTPNMHHRRPDLRPVSYISLLQCPKHVNFILFSLCLS